MAFKAYPSQMRPSLSYQCNQGEQSDYDQRQTDSLWPGSSSASAAKSSQRRREVVGAEGCAETDLTISEADPASRSAEGASRITTRMPSRAGFIWAFVVGNCCGWFLALLRNLGIGTWIFVIRSRNEMAEARDFLDQI